MRSLQNKNMFGKQRKRRIGKIYSSIKLFAFGFILQV